MKYNKISIGLLIGLLVGLLISPLSILATSPIKLIVNGKTITCDTAPQLIGGRLLVPVRAISEALGCSVIWDGQNALITSRPNNESQAINTTPQVKSIERDNEGLKLDSLGETSYTTIENLSSNKTEKIYYVIATITNTSDKFVHLVPLVPVLDANNDISCVSYIDSSDEHYVGGVIKPHSTVTLRFRATVPYDVAVLNWIFPNSTH